MIAKIHVPDDGEGYDLTLDDEGSWSCPEFSEIADSFNALHADTFTEWNGDFGVWQANDAAAKLGGTVVFLRA
jgi:hypothetical protein